MSPPLGRIVATIYRLEAQVGGGGAGAVYRALHLTLGSHVAVKFLLLTDDDARARFDREARIAATLIHPNVARVFDVGTDEDGAHYLVMEWIEGPSLSGYITARGPLSLRRAVALFTQITSAVDAAHERGIIHRDLKPDNILVAQPDSAPLIKLVDFGIARLDAQSTLTRDDVIGTPAYLAPECALRGSASADRRSDVYALGVILHECLSGRPAITGEPLDILERLIKKQIVLPSLHATRPELPPEIDQVIARATAYDPAQRFATAGELFRALAATVELPGSGPALAAPEGSLTLPSSPSLSLPIPSFLSTLRMSRARRRTLLVGGGVLVVGMVGLAVWRANTSDSLSVTQVSVAPTMRRLPSPTVRLQLHGVPREIRVVDTRRPSLPLPVAGGVLTLPRGTRPLRLRFEAAGFDAVELEVIPEADGEINLHPKPN